MREMAARICRDYLHGVWKHVTAENITLKRIRLGSMHDIYRTIYVSRNFTRKKEPLFLLHVLYDVCQISLPNPVSFFPIYMHVHRLTYNRKENYDFDRL